MVNETDFHIVTQRKPSANEIADCLFCWKVAKFVKSNAIVYAKDHATIGIGAGQMSRVYSAKIAGIKAQDGIDAAAKVGVTCVIQPGGSIRDDEVIQAANEHNMAMIFTQMRHFRH